MCKEPVSGVEWYNPDGQIVMVPYINTRTQMEGKDTIYMSNTSDITECCSECGGV